MRLSTLRTLLLRVLAAALIVGTAVGLRASGPATADATGWRAGVLIDRLETIGVIVVAVLLLPSLLLARWGRAEGPPRRRGRRPSTVVVLLVFAVGLAVALWLAHRQHHHRSAPLPDAVQQDPTPASPASAGQDEGPPWLLLTGLALVTGAAAVVGSRRRRTEGDEDVPEVAEPDGAPVWHAGARAAAAALHSRPQDPPRTRVLAAYEAFEAALAIHGVLRGPSGTATGLLDRAVAEGFPAADALLLTELFSAARYGEQPVTDEDVAAAERSLSSVLAAS